MRFPSGLQCASGTGSSVWQRYATGGAANLPRGNRWTFNGAGGSRCADAPPCQHLRHQDLSATSARGSTSLDWPSPAREMWPRSDADGKPGGQGDETILIADPGHPDLAPDPLQACSRDQHVAAVFPNARSQRRHVTLADDRKGLPLSGGQGEQVIPPLLLLVPSPPNCHRAGSGSRRAGAARMRARGGDSGRRTTCGQSGAVAARRIRVDPLPRTNGRHQAPGPGALADRARQAGTATADPGCQGRAALGERPSGGCALPGRERIAEMSSRRACHR